MANMGTALHTEQLCHDTVQRGSLIYPVTFYSSKQSKHMTSGQGFLIFFKEEIHFFFLRFNIFFNFTWLCQVSVVACGIQFPDQELHFPGGLVVRNLRQCRRLRRCGFDPWFGETPRRNGNPLQYSCLEKSQGQRSLVGYSP